MSQFRLLSAISASVALASCASLVPTQLAQAPNPVLHAKTITDDLHLWHVEAEPGAQVFSHNGKMTVTAPGGVTIWFKPKLQAPVEISYTITAIDEGGPHDRVSDLNQFWMASEPDSDDFFAPARSGKFAEYDALTLYYVGVGGHNNAKTRFRRYLGEQGNRPLLPEHDLSDPRFMIEANRPYRIRIVSEGHRQRFYRDGELLFDVRDDAPYLSGRFALRTVRNRMTVENFVVRRLN